MIATGEQIKTASIKIATECILKPLEMRLENSNPNFSGLKKLQKQVLKDVSNDRNIKISNVHDGKRMMKNTMRCRKVLIILDDVDHIDQLNALAGELIGLMREVELSLQQEMSKFW